MIDSIKEERRQKAQMAQDGELRHFRAAVTLAYVYRGLSDAAYELREFGESADLRFGQTVEGWVVDFYARRQRVKAVARPGSDVIELSSSHCDLRLEPQPIPANGAVCEVGEDIAKILATTMLPHRPSPFVR